MNYTILSLNVISMFSISPLYTVQKNYHSPLKTAFINSHFSRSFSSVFYSNTNRHQTVFHNDIFSHIINSAIFIKSETNEKNMDCFFVYPSEDESSFTFFKAGDLIHDIKVKPEHYQKNLDDKNNDNFRPYFRKNNEKKSICGDIKITNCVFNGCHADSFSGGSLHIEQEGSVLIHSTIFSNSHTNKKFGGACVICSSIDENNLVDFNAGKLQRLDIQYCCFQECSGADNAYGVAIFSAAFQTELYYASTVNCPGKDKVAEGAQFDLNSQTVTSHSVNSTGGNSVYCSGIEYRYTESGFFRFQSISDSKCRFAIAYTDVTGTVTKDLDLSYSNIFNIELINDILKNAYPGLIHVRKTNDNAQLNEFKVSNFCFIVGDDFNEPDNNRRIISRGHDGTSFQSIQITLYDCSFNCNNDKVGMNDDGKIIIESCNQGANPTTNTVSQLSLGDCQGGVKPEPLTPIPATSNFSESFYFTESGEFTYSNEFSDSDYLETPTNSDYLKTPTNIFSQSNKFTISNAFSESNEFSMSLNFKAREPPIVPEAGKGKNKTGMIAGVSVAAIAAVAIIAALVSFFLWKKKHMKFDENSADVVDGQESVISVDNNLNTVMQEDDPFAGDFTANN